MKFLLFMLLATVANAQWYANSVWAYPVPVDGMTLKIPTSHDRVSLVGFLTTTNNQAILGNLKGGTITATVQISTTNSPIFWWGNDCHSGIRFPNFRLYFTTTSEVYTLGHANANEREYWWAREAFAEVKQGTVTLTAQLDPKLWSNSQGHNGDDPIYTVGFLSAAARVAQIGLSFGGGCFYDVGVGIYNPDNPDSGATLQVMEYRVDRPRLVMIGLEPRLDGIGLIQYSDNLLDWADMPANTTTTTRFYRIKP